MIPEQVGPYRIERKIGSGGMGTVYYGVHEETDQIAAVKVLPASLAREPGFTLRFSREVEAMQTLINPHVVRVFESGVDENETYYYAMEYVDGNTLSKYIREQGRVPWRKVIDISIQICSALKAAHDAGIVHRDLKPSNLLIDSEDQVKLLDFGVAQVFASAKLTKTGGIIGTAEYMSPEQAKGQRATKKSDLYSLGAVMYAMLTARPPFTGETSMDVIRMHRFESFDRPRAYVPEIPHWLDDVVCTCLEKDPDKRYPDALVLSRRLKEIIPKYELSQSDEDATASGIVSGQAETVVAEDPAQPHAFGTLMRDMVRAEIDRQEHDHPVAKYFDNTYVLIFMLLAVIAGGVWWFWETPLTSEQRFEKGVELYESGSLYWSQAREEYFEPLLEEDPDQWSELIEPMMTKILLADLKKDFRINKLTQIMTSGTSETHRILRMAGKYYQFGDRGRAARLLEGLRDMLADDEDHERLRNAITELLVDVRTQVAESRQESESGNIAFNALSRAETLINAGDTERARTILRGLITLYDDDPWSEQTVQQARKLIDTLESSTP